MTHLYQIGGGFVAGFVVCLFVYAPLSSLHAKLDTIISVLRAPTPIQQVK